MPEQLDPSGREIELDGVRITSPGLSGMATVHFGSSPDLRAADDATPAFVGALAGAGMREQLTVEIADPVEYPAETTFTTRSTAAGDPGIAVDVPGPGSGLGQVLLSCGEDGVLTWHFPDDVPRSETATRGGERRTYTIPRRVVTDPVGGSRGIIGAVGKKLLKVLVFDLVDRVAGEVGDYFVDRWERAHRPHRLRGIAPGTQGDPTAGDLDTAGLAALQGGRALLFIHGTASRTNSGFARIPDPVLASLHSRYGDRVFAFDHPTIGTDPIANARWLGETLAAADLTLDVDIVAHSRGGLVARVLAEQPAAAAIDPARLRVGTTVFVATPNAGTVLADFDHLDKLLDRITNLLTLVPDNPVTDPLEVVLSVLKQLAVGALKGLDGLGSMNPKGKYLTEFMNVASPATSTYRAVASNFEPPGNAPLARLARDIATDALFAPDKNDLVVPTEGVYAASDGSLFPIADPLVFGDSASVDHSSYWTRPELHDAFAAWLTG